MKITLARSGETEIQKSARKIRTACEDNCTGGFSKVSTYKVHTNQSKRLHSSRKERLTKNVDSVSDHSSRRLIWVSECMQISSPVVGFVVINGDIAICRGIWPESSEQEVSA